MLVRYRFVNETVEIEVSEEWGSVLAEQDRLEYNNEQKETRRHISLDASRDSGIELAAATIAPGEERLRSIMEQLTPEQQELVKSLFSDGLTQSEYANKKGIRQSGISRRLASMRKRLRDFR